MFGDGDLMRVATEVFDDGIRPLEGGLGVDDPVLGLAAAAPGFGVGLCGKGFRRHLQVTSQPVVT